jgi:hypothetical protein
MNTFFYDSYQLILIFLCPGFFLGVVYDFFRILRIARTHEKEKILDSVHKHFKGTEYCAKSDAKKAENILVFTEDFVFCVVATLIEILLFYHLNDGVIRIYAILLSIIGFFVYHYSLGRILIYTSKRIINFVRRIIYFVLIAILTPLIVIYKWCNIVFNAIIHKRHTHKKKRRARRKNEKQKSVNQV